MNRASIEEIRTNLADESLEQAVARVRVALEFIEKDPRATISTKVAGDFDFEELVSALVIAERVMQSVIDANDPFERGDSPDF